LKNPLFFPESKNRVAFACEWLVMRGKANRQPNLFVHINLEEKVPADHPLREIKRMTDEALKAMSRTFAAAYSETGRPGVPPERLLKAMVLLALYTVRSERALCERIEFDLLFRWFLDMTPDEECFDHSVFSVNRERLEKLEVTRKFKERIVFMAIDAGLISDDHFSVDGSLLQSHASLKSLKHIEKIKAEKEAAAKAKADGEDKPKGDRPDSNGWVDFKGQRRGNATHRSTTDPESRLFTKGSGQAALLYHSMHVLMENRNGFAIDIQIDAADGKCEHRSALKLIDRVGRSYGIEPSTLGADKNYDCGSLLVELDKRDVDAHVACKSVKEIDPNDPGSWERWHNQQRQQEPGYKVSQQKRKRAEEIFGWFKQIGGLRRSRLVGRWKIQQLADVALSTLNMVRMMKLLAT